MTFRRMLVTMMGNYILNLAADRDLDRLQFLSSQARERYKSIASLIHVASSPSVSAERFKGCRVVVVREIKDAPIAGYAAMRPLDGLLYLDNISVDARETGRGIGNLLMAAVLSHARSINLPAIALTTFREPKWNGPWFRKHGFQPMPPNRIGPDLRQIIERQSETLDPDTREALWHLL